MKAILYGFGAMGQKIYHQMKNSGDSIEAVVSLDFPIEIPETK